MGSLKESIFLKENSISHIQNRKNFLRLRRAKENSVDFQWVFTNPLKKPIDTYPPATGGFLGYPPVHWTPCNHGGVI